MINLIDDVIFIIIDNANNINIRQVCKEWDNYYRNTKHVNIDFYIYPRLLTKFKYSHISSKFKISCTTSFISLRYFEYAKKNL